MNLIDMTILNGLNNFSHLSWKFDFIVHFISFNHLVKGGVLLTLFWWLWFKKKTQPYVQQHLTSTLYGCFVAMVLARALQLLLPFRLRPLHEQGLEFVLPYTMRPMIMKGWSSFPSDHAVLFFALSVGIVFVSKKAGIFALIYTTLVISLPRMYLGLHYPTDILGGACIGISISLLCNTKVFTKKIAQRTLDSLEDKPEILYTLLFFISFQLIDMFSSCRAFVPFFQQILK